MMSTRLAIHITYLELGRLHLAFGRVVHVCHVLSTGKQKVESPRHVRTTNGNTEVQTPESG